GQIARGSEQAIETRGVHYDCVWVQLLNARGEFVSAAGCCGAGTMDAGEHKSKANQMAKGKWQKAKVFWVRGLCCSMWSRIPRKSCEQFGAPDQITSSRLASNDRAAQDLAYGPCSSTNSTEFVF